MKRLTTVSIIKEENATNVNQKRSSLETFAFLPLITVFPMMLNQEIVLIAKLTSNSLKDSACPSWILSVASSMEPSVSTAQKHTTLVQMEDAFKLILSVKPITTKDSVSLATMDTL